MVFAALIICGSYLFVILKRFKMVYLFNLFRQLPDVYGRSIMKHSKLKPVHTYSDDIRSILVDFIFENDLPYRLKMVTHQVYYR